MICITLFDVVGALKILTATRTFYDFEKQQALRVLWLQEQLNGIVPSSVHQMKNCQSTMLSLPT